MNDNFLGYNNKYIELDPDVEKALTKGKPVVALESTIISHGMPYPKNIETALELEQIVRDKDAVPATIALINGKIKVGISRAEITKLAESETAIKVSTRDLSSALVNKQLGATTVAGTLICAELVGIKFFATGGIGGVHRNGHRTFDISADLIELSKRNVCVICSGAKSILDLSLTLEYLETQGVPVLGYQTTEFPAFYTPSSGISLSHYSDSLAQVSEILETKWDLGISGGVVLANPIPEKHSLNSDEINNIISDAIKEADEQGIHGKEVTPFLLSKIEQKTQGDSLTANIALVKHNTAVAAELSREFHVK